MGKPIGFFRFLRWNRACRAGMPGLLWLWRVVHAAPRFTTAVLGPGFRRDDEGAREEKNTVIPAQAGIQFLEWNRACRAGMPDLLLLLRVVLAAPRFPTAVLGPGFRRDDEGAREEKIPSFRRKPESSSLNGTAHVGQVCPACFCFCA
jgi:hypothetical protein